MLETVQYASLKLPTISQSVNLSMTPKRAGYRGFHLPSKAGTLNAVPIQNSKRETGHENDILHTSLSLSFLWWFGE
jgi:hypothetical protein